MPCSSTLITRIARSAGAARRILHAAALVTAATAAVCAVSPANAEAYDYTIKVRTADKWLAGTDANVKVKLDGAYGLSGPWKQLDTKYHNDFERDSKGTYVQVLDNFIGPVGAVHVERDNWGASPGWLLSYIEVHNSGNDLTQYFMYGGWLPANTPTRLTPGPEPGW